MLQTAPKIKNAHLNISNVIWIKILEIIIGSSYLYIPWAWANIIPH